MNRGEDRYAHLAAHLLKREAPPAESRAPDGRRDAVVAAMALAIAGRARRRRLVWAGGAGLAAAASVVFVLRAMGGGPPALLVEQTSGTGSELLRGESIQPLENKRVLAVGDIVRVGQDSMTTLVTGNGTHVTLAAGQLRVDELGAQTRFLLASGHLRAQVARLSPRERFLVRTPDSEVEVHGTTFAVRVGPPAAGCRGQASQSTVAVSEGAVWVRSGERQVLLGPGESWTTACVDAAPDANKASAGGTTREPGPDGPADRGGAKPAGTSATPKASPRRVTAAPPEQAPTAAAEPVSHLAEQNDLLAAAMAAERQGQHEAALRHLDDLIRRFPEGPLRESAQAERERIRAAQSAR
jgi:hypothetical protein